MESLITDQHLAGVSPPIYDGVSTTALSTEASSEDECGGGGGRNSSTHMSVSSEPITHHRGDRGVSMLYHGTWPVERTMWNSDPTTLKTETPPHNHMEVTSVMSFASSSGGVPLDRVLGSPCLSRRSSQQLEAKVDMVYSLLAMLSGQEHADMGETLLALSTNPESCLAMRQSGCIPLLVQMVQSDKEFEARNKASQALHNLIHSQTDEKVRKREIRVFKLMEHTRAYIEALKNNREFQLDTSTSSSEDGDRHPIQTIAHLMKLSFDEGHRQSICQLGGIHTIANLVEAEHGNHGSTTDEAHCILLRRYACMALTNLTFGDSGNKALLCSFRDFMRVLVIQLQNPSDELRQVTASVLRNLSWRADSTSKEVLREAGSVTGLMKSAMLDNKENTLKSILSALWNLSAHCTENKSEICSVDGALGFLVDTLTYKTPSKSLAIIENSGGILRNISSQIAVRDDYREILRQHNCLQILLDQLKSPSLTIVSNACGTLWNLSAKCAIDQELLWQMGAPAMLRSLNHSKHKMIAMGSSAALKNLLSSKPSENLLPQMDSTAIAMDLPILPTLGARKQKALLQDLDQTLSETYENIEKDSPIKVQKEENKIQPEPNFCLDQTDNDSYLSNDFSSLTNTSQPSTSYDSRHSIKLPMNSGSTSLPTTEVLNSKHNSRIAIPVRKYGDSQPKSFMKNMPKNVAKFGSSSDDYNNYECNNDNKSFITNTDSGLSQATNYYNSDVTSSDLNNASIQNFSGISSSGSSVDNDKIVKSKEINAHLDEKDHCSIEDVSDVELPVNSQNQSYDSYQFYKQENADSDCYTSGFESQKELPLPSSSKWNSNLDDVEINDILVQVVDGKILMEETEKQDNEREKRSDLERVEEEQNINISSKDSLIPTAKPVNSKIGKVQSGIPLPKSIIKLQTVSSHGSDLSSGSDIKTTVQGNCKKSNNSSISLLTSCTAQTSTPAKHESSAGGDDGGNLRQNKTNIETYEVQNDISDDIALVPRCLDAENFTLTISPIIKDLELQHALQNNSKLNISSENNSSFMDISHEKYAPCDLQQPSTSNEILESVILSPDIPQDIEKEKFNVENCAYLNTENFSTANDCRDRLLERSCEETNRLDNRMLDPDAMIESLDRFTAELVSQSSHLQSNKASDNTWNEDTCPNDQTFPSLSSGAPGVITFDSDKIVEQDVVDNGPNNNEKEQKSNDFSSINTSTMTESTLIAIEATKMATVFQNEAQMSQSITSVQSLEFELNVAGSPLTQSPKMTSRKKSLPPGLMVRRALSNSLNNGSSLESLDNHSLSNLDQINPPSALGFDLEGSLTSVASLPSDQIRADFVINGAVSRNQSTFNVKQPLSLLVSNMTSVSDLDNINPPSLLYEITDLCNSLADVPTEAICSETEVFEDCYTHVLDPTIQTEDDVTEFSDANSVTPIQSDCGSSPDVSPKRSKPGSIKRRRNLARDRYRTYTVAPDKESTSEDFKTVGTFDEFQSIAETTYVSPTYTLKSSSNSKLTPRERRQMDRSRFETQVVEEAITDVLQQPKIGETPTDSSDSQASPLQSPARTKLSIRRNFIQKRLENKDRFRTQTLSESSFSPDISSSASPPIGEQDLHLLVQKEANLVLKSLREVKTSSGNDELLDCETLSLVSNDEDSEHNSGSSINYRTYHKSWGFRKNVPVVPSSEDLAPNCSQEQDVQESDNENEMELQMAAKPKITKPNEKTEVPENDDQEEDGQSKGIRGRRKALYSKSNLGSKLAPKTFKPIKTMTSNLVRNVATTIKNNSPAAKGKTLVAKKPPVPQSKGSSGYGTKSSLPSKGLPKSSATSLLKPPGATKNLTVKGLERQGTFTKDDIAKAKAGTKIPKPPSKIPAKPTTVNNTKPANSTSRFGFIKSKSSDRANDNVKPTYSRSTSADSRDSKIARIQTSSSSQSLKNQNGAVKKSAIPQMTARSSSNSSLNSKTESTSARKQVTSKIASLWKKIEESKKQQPTKKDTRVWIQTSEPSHQPQEQLIRSNTFDNKDQVILRNKVRNGDDNDGGDEEVKRISRLGSFIVMDDEAGHLQQVINANNVAD